MAITAPITIPALAQAYADAFAAGQYLHQQANEADDDPQMLADAYREQDRATALAMQLARTPAQTIPDLLRKVAALTGLRHVTYPAAEAIIRGEAERLLAG